MSDPVAQPPEHSASSVEQGEMPFAIVQGAPYTELPRDLYIPPEALQIFLDAFEGPLDLLLYLIKRQNLDILDIPIARITHQYMQYIELMQELQLELAGEYLLMAAMLAEIKSRMLLPRPVSEEDEEEDPRAELVRRLQEYERYKQAAEDLDQLPRLERDVFVAVAEFPYQNVHQEPPPVSLDELLRAFAEVLERAEMYSHHHVTREPLSVRERMGIVLSRLSAEEFTSFTSLFTVEEGRAGAVVTLLAILELMKESLALLVQNEINGPIYLKAAA
ncbi:MAG: ScpA family protein [Gammaproteobacteria bacterium]|nr:ScpA family protein [Gammaproteobacteria bacterium]